MKRYVYVLAIGIVGILAAIVFINKILYSSTTLVFKGDHNTVTTIVQVDDKRLYPTGKDGKNYTFRALPGKYKAAVSGPTIKPTETDIEVKMLSSQSRTIMPVTLSATEVVSQLVIPEVGEAVASVIVFGADDWLAVRLDNTNPRIDSRLFILGYDYEQLVWKVLASGVKISSADPGFNNAPGELIEYINSAGGD